MLRNSLGSAPVVRSAAGLLRQLAGSDAVKALVVAGGGLALIVRALSAQASSPAALEQVHILYPQAPIPGKLFAYTLLLVGGEGQNTRSCCCHVAACCGIDLAELRRQMPWAAASGPAVHADAAQTRGCGRGRGGRLNLNLNLTLGGRFWACCPR